MASAMDTDVLKVLEGIQPLKGQVVHIKTVQETRPNEEYGKCSFSRFRSTWQSAMYIRETLDRWFDLVSI